MGRASRKGPSLGRRGGNGPSLGRRGGKKTTVFETNTGSKVIDGSLLPDFETGLRTANRNFEHGTASTTRTIRNFSATGEVRQVQKKVLCKRKLKVHTGSQAVRHTESVGNSYDGVQRWDIR